VDIFNQQFEVVTPTIQWQMGALDATLHARLTKGSELEGIYFKDQEEVVKVE
jgi:hypothetical protein